MSLVTGIYGLNLHGHEPHAVNITEESHAHRLTQYHFKHDLKVIQVKLTADSLWIRSLKEALQTFLQPKGENNP